VSDLRVPVLDDLRFQDLVDAAKRYLPQRVPAWTDHNVSDPGITLIEACATRVDQLGYRTDQVPDVVRAALLRLAGVVPSPPAGARVDLTFTLSDAAATDRTIAAGTLVTTRPDGPGAVISFRTLADLTIPAGTASGTVAAVNIVTVHEDLGAATGTPALRLAPSRVPLMADEPDGTRTASLVLTVVSPDQSTQVWRQVSTFADAADSDPCFLWDASARQIVFGPLAPYASGARRHGAVPVAGARVVVDYQTAQGALGNIPARTPLVWARGDTIAVTNAGPAAGGADAETVPDAVTRTVADLVPLQRAVTADDYAQVLTRRVPGVSRVLALPVPGLATDPADNGHLQVTVAPKPVGDPRQKLGAPDLHLSADTVQAVGTWTQSARLLCARVRVTEPDWTRFSVTATVRSWSSGESPAALAGRAAAAQALFAFFHPTVGGPDGRGWPFGRPIHAGDAYSVLAALPEVIDVVELTLTDQAGFATTRIVPLPQGLPALEEATVSFVTSDQDTFDRVPQGMWGLFDGPDGTGKLLALFHGDAAGLETGIGASAKSLVNATASTLQAFSQPTKNMTGRIVYPGTTGNLVFGPNQKLSSATVYTAVPDGAFCLYEHAGQTGKQWIFWSADTAVDLAQAGIGAGKSVSSVFNGTSRTLDLRQDAARTGPGQLFRPGLPGDVVVALDNKLRYATLLNGPGAGQYCLYGAAALGGRQWVFDAGVPDLSGFLGAGDSVLSVSNQTADSLVLYGGPGFMSGAGGMQPVPPRTTADVRGPLAGSVASAQYRPTGSVFAWGTATPPLADLPSGLTDVFAVAAGASHCLALKADGSVVAWGSNGNGQAAVPAGLTASAVAAGTKHSLALAADGTVAAWGSNDDAQTSVPAGLTAVAVAAGTKHSLALKADGTVVVWGAATGAGGANLAPSGLTGVTAVAAGALHSLALKADGSVVAWGANDSGQAAVPAGLTAVAVAAGAAHSVALKADGSVVAWGANDVKQTTVPTGLVAVAVAAGANRSAALTADGTVVAWGGGTDAGQPFAVLPVTTARSVALALGDTQSLAVSVTN
jgi:Regulator of chromosome condensation (RCC1) repeat/Peptidase inhibitor family I36